MDPHGALMSAPPCEPGRVLPDRTRFVYDAGSTSPRLVGLCRVVSGPALVLAVVWDRGVWCGLVASGGTCGWIGMGEL